MAAKARVGCKSMWKIIQEDLNMKPYCLQKHQVLSSAMMKKRLTRSKLLLNFMKSGMQPSIIWTDERIFTVQTVHNAHNDCILAKDFNSILVPKRTVFQRQKPAPLMVWAGVTSCGGKTPVIFILEGVKVNQKVYLAMLKDQIKPWISSLDWPKSCLPTGQRTLTRSQECPSLVQGKLWGVLGQGDVTLFLSRLQCHGLCHIVHSGEEGWGQNQQQCHWPQTNPWCCMGWPQWKCAACQLQCSVKEVEGAHCHWQRLIVNQAWARILLSV